MAVKSTKSFTFPDAPERHVSYLNHAKEATLSAAVKDAAWAKVKKEAWEEDDVDDRQRVRELFASLIGAETQDIAIVPSTAFAMTLAANNLARLRPQGGKIVVLQDEMCSEVYAWQHIINVYPQFSLAVVPIDASDLTQALIDHVDDSCAVVCIPLLHWSTGALLDTIQISDHCAMFDIALVLDGTQSIGVMQFNIKEYRAVSMVACSVQKWLRGPPGNSMIYLNYGIQQVWHPLDQHGRNRELKPNWNAYPSTMTDKGYPEAYLPDARKFDAGGHVNPIHLAMLRASMEEVCRLNLIVTQEKLTALLNPLLKWVFKRGWWVPAKHAGHLVGIRPSSCSVSKMLEVCKSLESDGIYISVRNGFFRVSPYVTNTPGDIARLIEGFEKYAS